MELERKLDTPTKLLCTFYLINSLLLFYYIKVKKVKKVKLETKLYNNS